MFQETKEVNVIKGKKGSKKFLLWRVSGKKQKKQIIVGYGQGH